VTGMTAFIMILYLVCAAADITAVIKKDKKWERILKPLLMPLLIVWYLLAAQAPRPLIILALAAGFLGDTFLLGKGVFFVYGLLAFLAGQIFYIAAFLGDITRGMFAGGLFLAAIFYIGYAGIGCRLVFGELAKKQKPAVVVYMICLLGMSFAALLRFRSVSALSFRMTFAGSLLFVASDSLLAFRVFIQKSEDNTSPVVMLTYTAAQLLIVTGMAAL